MLCTNYRVRLTAAIGDQHVPRISPRHSSRFAAAGSEVDPKVSANLWRQPLSIEEDVT